MFFPEFSPISAPYFPSSMGGGGQAATTERSGGMVRGSRVDTTEEPPTSMRWPRDYGGASVSQPQNAQWRRPLPS